MRWWRNRNKAPTWNYSEQLYKVVTEIYIGDHVILRFFHPNTMFLEMNVPGVTEGAHFFPLPFEWYLSYYTDSGQLGRTQRFRNTFDKNWMVHHIFLRPTMLP